MNLSYSIVLLAFTFIGGTESSNLRASTSSFFLNNNESHRDLGGGCPDKKVRISGFKIEGDIDWGDAEIKLSLMGSHYYPTDGRDYAEFEEGKFYNIHESWKRVESYKSLKVGATEVDVVDDDHYNVSLKSSEWHSDTCDPYELVITKTIDNGSNHKVCFDVGAGGSAKAVDLDGGIEYCCEWTKPKDSIFWYVEVLPTKTSSASFCPGCACAAQ